MKYFSYTLVSILILALFAASGALADQCEACHNSSIFKVKHKAIYDYHVDFEASVHKNAGLMCVDCHGGDAVTEDKDIAHVGVREKVSQANIDDTCGQCHQDQYEAFVGSPHYLETKDDKEALNCVGCHDSMKTDVAFVGKVHRHCMRCHDDSDDPDSIDVQTAAILSRINAIVGYRLLLERNEYPKPTDSETDLAFERMVRQWHTLDLECVNSTAEELLTDLR